MCVLRKNGSVFYYNLDKEQNTLKQMLGNYKGFTNFVSHLDTRHSNTVQMSAVCDDRELAILFKGKHSPKAERGGCFIFLSFFVLASHCLCSTPQS